MKSNTHIAVVLDRSGSMSSMAQEIIGGFNAFLAEQKKVPGTATLTLVQFDNVIDRLATFKPLGEIADLNDKTYEPRGATRLYDAIGLTVSTVRDEIEKAADKPEKVLILVLTDGQENSSEEYTTEMVQAMIADQQKAGWEFSFIGANQDAILTARGLGVKNAAASSLSFDASPQGATNMMRSMSAATATFRRAVAGTAYCYSEADRAAQSSVPSSLGEAQHKAVFSEAMSKAGATGGVARAAALSPKQRSAIARTGAKARWSGSSV